MAGVKGRSGGSRKGSGRKPFVPTDEQRRVVERGAAYGLTIDQILQMVINPRTKQPIGAGTLNRMFQRQLDSGHAKAVLMVADALFVNATKHMNVAAQIYFLKCIGKWTEAPFNVNATLTHSGSHLGDIGEQLVAAIARLRLDGSADETGDSEPYRGTTH